VSGNLEGTIPDAWLSADKHNEVLGFVRALAVPGTLKQKLFAKWSMTVGYEATPADFRLLGGRAHVKSDEP
jgi:hypothetical protein